MLRRIVLVCTIAAILLSLSFVVAAQDTEWTCGDVPADISATFNYTGWEGPGEVEKFTMTFDEFFEANYPGIQQVPNTGVAWSDYWTTLPAQLAGGAEIDMIWLHDSRNDTFAENGWLTPLDDLLEACPPPGWPDRFIPTQIEAFNFDGVQYAFPYDIAPGGFYINVDLFEEAGIPLPTEETTWEEILEMAVALTQDTDGDGENDVFGLNNLAWPGANAGGMYWIVKSFGGDYWNEDITESRLNDPATIETLQFLSDLIWEHGVHPTAGAVATSGFDSELYFANGNVAMHYGLNDVASRFGELIGDDFNWTVAPTPAGPAGRYQFVGGSAFAIPASSSQPELAYELIRYTLANPDHIARTAEMGSAFTSHLDFTDAVLPEDSPIREAYEHSFVELGAENGIHPAYHPKYQEWETSIFISLFDLLWTGEERDAAVIAEQAHELTNELLGG